MTHNSLEIKHGPAEGWREMLAAGDGYRKTARNARNRPAVFTPSIIRNVCAMGIESYFMAAFLYTGTLPHNHTMADLIRDAEKQFTVDPVLKKTMLKIDDEMQLCTLEAVRISDASAEDVPLFLEALDAAAAFAGGVLDTHAQTADS